MVEYDGPYLQLDKVKLDHLLNSPQGAVGGHMRRVGLKILFLAKATVPARTGRLRQSLYFDHRRTSRHQYIQVGSNLHYAHEVHEGTKPHVIEPHAGRVLVFNVGGRRVFAEQVHHPGTKGRKYLTVPMRRSI